MKNALESISGSPSKVTALSFGHLKNAFGAMRWTVRGMDTEWMRALSKHLGPIPATSYVLPSAARRSGTAMSESDPS